MRISIRILIGIALVGCIYAAIGVNWSNLNASGVVQDYVTKRPVAGATLRLDCRETDHWFGTESIRTVETISSEDGRYSFKFSDTWDCDYIVLTPEKQGYKNLFGLGVPNILFAPFDATVPRQSWLVADGDQTRLRLEGWLETSRSAPVGPTLSMPGDDYLRVFGPFSQSKQIATRPADVTWVREHYCKRLADLYASTSSLGRERLANFSYSVDYETHVRPYCAAQDESGSDG